MTRGHEAIMQLLQARRPEPGLLIPPPCLVELKGEFVEHDDRRRVLTARFAVDSRYENPARAMQGGFIAAAIDNVMGPLCYLHAEPSTTLTFESRFIRPVMPETRTITVSAEITDLTRRFLHLQATVTRDDGKLAVRAHSVFSIV